MEKVFKCWHEYWDQSKVLFIIVSVPEWWTFADICENFGVAGKKIYYIDDADRLICAGKIDS